MISNYNKCFKICTGFNVPIGFSAIKVDSNEFIKINNGIGIRTPKSIKCIFS